MKVHFIAGRAPSQDPSNIIALLNYCSEHNWEIVRMSREMATAQNSILDVKGKQQVIPIDVVYCAVTPEEFKNNFGMDYSMEAAVSVLEEIESRLFIDQVVGSEGVKNV